jgi:hypothetical protein
MSKSEKKIYITFLLITFFGAFFQNFFNGFGISIKFCVVKKNVMSYLYFFPTLIANAQEMAQKNGKSFFMNVS